MRFVNISIIFLYGFLSFLPTIIHATSREDSVIDKRNKRDNYLYIKGHDDDNQLYLSLSVLCIKDAPPEEVGIFSDLLTEEGSHEFFEPEEERLRYKCTRISKDVLKVAFNYLRTRNFPEADLLSFMEGTEFSRAQNPAQKKSQLTLYHRQTQALKMQHLSNFLSWCITREECVTSLTLSVYQAQIASQSEILEPQTYSFERNKDEEGHLLWGLTIYGDNPPKIKCVRDFALCFKDRKCLEEEEKKELENKAILTVNGESVKGWTHKEIAQRFSELPQDQSLVMEILTKRDTR